MTVCKTFTRVPLEKGKLYKRADLIDNPTGTENMVFTYYDPPRDELRTFFEEENNDWIITNDTTGLLRSRHRTLPVQEETPAWERTKIRHVFLHRKSQSKGEYEYLGTAIDESRLTVAGREERQFDIQ